MAGDAATSAVGMQGKPSAEPAPNPQPLKLRRNPLSYVFFSWFTPIFIKGWRKPLEFVDLYDIPADLKTDEAFEKFEADWDATVRAAADGGERGRAHLAAGRRGDDSWLLSSSFLRAHWLRLTAVVALQLLYTASTFGGPLLLNQITKFLELPESAQQGHELTRAYLLAMAMFLIPAFGTLVNSMSNRISIGTQVMLRAELNAAMYEKALRLSMRSRQQVELGRIVNIMSQDVNQLQQFLYPYIQQLVTGPATIIACIVLLWFQIQWTTFLALGILIITLALSGACVGRLMYFRRDMLKQGDLRVKLMNQLLTGIRVLKMYAWETTQEAVIMKVRKDELHEYARAIPYRMGMICTMAAGPVVAMVVSFSVYGVTNPEQFTPSAIFTAISLFQLLRTPLMFLPFALMQMANSMVSIRRLTAFLLAEDRTDYVEPLPGPGVEIQDATFFWAEPPPPVVIEIGAKKKKGQKGKGEEAAQADAGQDAPAGPEAANAEPEVVSTAQEQPQLGGEDDPKVVFWLRDINLKVAPGELVCIVGRVGQGKSSLIQAILGEMDKQEGTVKVGGRVAYVPQQAWIMNATLKENVLFGKPFDEQHWQEAIEYACVQTDLEVLPAGAETEIGEKGINLSGGQKQRVSLARALYQDGDMYIMDDPLSAVDVHVGKALFENLICKALKGKTRLLVTNSLQYAPRADKVVVIDGGRIVASGTYEDCLQNECFATLVREHAAEVAAAEEEEHEEAAIELAVDAMPGHAHALGREETQPPGTPDVESVLGGDGHADESMPNGTPNGLDHTKKGTGGGELVAHVRRMVAKEGKRGVEGRSSSYKTSRESSVTTKTGGKPTSGALMTAEEREVGKVAWAVYWSYIVCYGPPMALLLLIFWGCEETLNVLASWWLSVWTNAESVSSVETALGIPHSFNRMRYIGGYLGFSFGYIIMLGLRQGSNLISSITASRKVYHRSLSSVQGAPVSFFDTTPVGRILNRFSKDTMDMDLMLAITLSQLGTCIMNLAGTIIFIAVIQPWILVGVGPLAVVYFFIQLFYRRSYIEFQRHDAVSRSPIYAHFSETLTGVDTLRAYGATPRAIATARAQVDTNHRAYWCLGMAGEWLSVRLDIMGALIVFLVAILAVVNRNQSNVSLMALTLSQALSVTQFLKMAVNMAAQFESKMNAVERLVEYWDLPQEKGLDLPDKTPPDTWPDAGALEYQDVWMRYRPGLDSVLKGVSFAIEPRDKLGIVGRTGSGKSSLIVSLFRLAEPYRGDIILDGLSILTLGLRDLRSRIAVIPQDPVLFSGTVRSNLDPFGKCGDAEIWEALGQVDLRTAVMALDGGLDARVAENGENFSVGQRQLICLARALLRDPQVLVADEATASVDSETDAFIQKTIRRQFRHCTVITIAHRINTILDSTKVLVMDAGRVAEFNTVQNLMNHADSTFRGMVLEARAGWHAPSQTDGS